MRTNDGSAVAGNEQQGDDTSTTTATAVAGSDPSPDHGSSRASDLPEQAATLEPAEIRRRVPDWLEVTAAWGWRLIVLGAVVGLLWRGAATILVVTLPLAIALILATLSIPARDWLTRRGFSDVAAAMVVVIGGLVAFIGLFAALAPAFADQITELGPTVLDGWEEFLAWLESGPFGLDPALFDDLGGRAQDMLTGGGSDAASGVLGGVLSGVATVGQILAGLALTIVLLFFIVKDYPELLDWISRMLPAEHRATTTAVGARAWSALAGYVRGTAVIALIDAVGIGIGLAVLGVPLVLPLMVLVFFGGFLPVIGAFLAGLIAVLVALADGGITTALIVLAIILVVQQVEGNFLQPTIMRRAVALHPIVVLMALTAGGAVGGIIGAFLSVPFAAVLAAVGNEVRLRREAGVLTAGADAPSEPL